MTQFDNGHFKKCNDWLAERYGEDGIIDWSLTPVSKAAVSPPAPSSTSSTGANKENTAPLTDALNASVVDQKDQTGRETTATKEVVEDEFDDEDALEALVEAEKKEILEEVGENTKKVA